MDNLTKANEEIKIAEDISRGHDLTIELALQSAQAYAAIAQAENASSQAHSLERIAESLERMLPVLAYIHVQLGNIHQTLITPNANGEPVSVTDLLRDGIHQSKRSRYSYGDLFGLHNLTPILAPDPQDYKTEAAYLEALDKFNDFRAQVEADKEQ